MMISLVISMTRVRTVLSATASVSFYQPTEALSFYTSLGSFYIPDKTTTLDTKSSALLR